MALHGEQRAWQRWLSLGHAAKVAPVVGRGHGEDLRGPGGAMLRSGGRGKARMAQIREETRGGHGGHGEHRELLKLEREAGEGAGSEVRLLVCSTGPGDGYL